MQILWVLDTPLKTPQIHAVLRLCNLSYLGLRMQKARVKRAFLRGLLTILCIGYYCQTVKSTLVAINTGSLGPAFLQWRTGKSQLPFVPRCSSPIRKCISPLSGKYAQNPGTVCLIFASLSQCNIHDIKIFGALDRSVLISSLTISICSCI